MRLVAQVVALFLPSSCAEEIEEREEEECTEERNNGRLGRDKQKPAILEATPVKDLDSRYRVIY